MFGMLVMKCVQGKQKNDFQWPIEQGGKKRTNDDRMEPLRIKQGNIKWW